jgi:hypothetical protein
MSRAKAKFAMLHDLQNRQSDIILTKKDCDLISDALYTYFGTSIPNDVRELCIWLSNLKKIR